MEALNTLFQAASQEMYAQQGDQGAPTGGANGEAGGAEANADDEVTDVDFEEVK